MGKQIIERIKYRIKKFKETEGDGLEDWLYLIHHLHEQKEIQHCLKGLVEDQDVYWSNEEAEADGETVPCANRQLES